MAGNGHSITGPGARVIVDMDLLTHIVKVSGESPTLECTLAMLQQAARAVEQQMRHNAALQLQQDMRDAAIITKVGRDLQKG